MSIRLDVVENVPSAIFLLSLILSSSLSGSISLLVDPVLYFGNENVVFVEGSNSESMTPFGSSVGDCVVSLL